MSLFAVLALLMPCCTVSVSVRTGAGQPVPKATVRAGDIAVNADERGLALVPLPAPGKYPVEASAPGFQPLRKEVEVASGETVDVEFTLLPVERQSITVEEKIATDGSASTIAPVTAEQMKRLPTDPPTVKEALPLIPGVLRTPEGRLRISGSPEYRSTLLVNSLDVTDPATGKFGATVPIDSVLSLNVFKSPFLAEYGRFTAAVVVVDTIRGGDKWRYELNDPTPELRIRSRHIRGVRGFTPRFSISGPLIRNKLYLSQSAEYRLNKSPVFTLPFPENESWREQWNSLTQLDAIASAAHTLTATVHIVPQKVNWANLSFYTPRRAAPGFRAREFHTGITDRLTVGGGILETALSASEVTGRTTPHGVDEMTLTPVRNLGNYFAAQDRRARRYQWLESYTVTRGAHTWKAGASAIRSTLGGWFRARPIHIADQSGAVLQRIDFVNRPGYRLTDTETGAYVQDHWQLRPNLSFDAGIRADWQRIAATLRVAPRLGVAWAPFGDASTVFRSGVGWFYDRVPLSVYAFGSYPEQIVDGLRLANRIDNGGEFKPRSRNWQAQVEHRFGPSVRVRAGYLESYSEGLMVLSPGAHEVTLQGTGQARYRQLEVISQVSLWEGQNLFLSYVRSAGRGNLNEFAEWLGDFPSPLIRPDVYATVPANMPHRFLMWGVIPFNAKTRLAPVVEYRTGLPYAALDARQQYAGEPYSRRFPNFLSVDFRVARDIHIRNHAVQISFSMFNVTNHWNPDAVRWNVADPQFGEFLGQHRRRFRLDFDFLF